jgi:hypothetical protein
LSDGKYDVTERYEISCEGSRTPRYCRLDEIRPLRGGAWPKRAGKEVRIPEPVIDHALDLIGKRVRVWYASARKWRVVTVKSLVLGPVKGVPDRVHFRVARAGRVNPWCYSMAEIRPIGERTPGHRKPAPHAA